MNRMVQAPPEETVTGGDWSEFTELAAQLREERVIVNFGPQHPSSHGVLRLVLELDGETVTEVRAGIGYLHTGIEKNMEFRTWTQGVTFCTRMDYVAQFFNEAAYCLAVEKLLGITERIPARAGVLRVLMMELNRVTSHLVCIGSGGMEIGSTTAMTIAMRARERIMAIFEAVTGLRMNNAYIRPGGVAMDLPPGAIDLSRTAIPLVRQDIHELELLLDENPIVKGRMVGVAGLDLSGCMALGVTGPVLRATGLPHDLRRADPYCDYETYDFDVATRTTCDAYGRMRVRFDEMTQSLTIAQQCLDRLQSSPGPVMVADKKIAWPAQLALGADGLGTGPDHIRTIMAGSMESLIHHFKLVTEGFPIPEGQSYAAVESPKGELGCHVVSDGGTRPYRAHFRDPSFSNLQAVVAMCEGAPLADLIVAVGSIDPVMGGVDR